MGLKMTPKKCTQCGLLKEPTEFRQYTKPRTDGTHGRYRICKACEALNMRYTRAMADGNAAEFERLTELFRALEALGFRTPLQRKPRDVTSTEDVVDDLMRHHGMTVDQVIRRIPQEPSAAIEDMLFTPYGGVLSMGADALEDDDTISDPGRRVPEELQHWLDEPLESWWNEGVDPEYLQETIYESLKAKYRPQTGVDRESYLPIYDDTYKDVLNGVLRRFDDYEEMYMLKSAEELEGTIETEEIEEGDYIDAD